MSDEKKIEKKVDKKLSLTDLTADVGSLTALLQRHTSGRNFLYQAATGATDAPILRLSSPVNGDKEYVELNLADLDAATAEILMGAVIAHEQKLAIQCWQALNANTSAALSVIAQIEKQHEQAKKAAEDPKSADEPTTLPFPVKP
jgi:hypothetical protein